MRTTLPRLMLAAALPYRGHGPLQMLRRSPLIKLCSTTAGEPSDFAALGLHPLLLPGLAAEGIRQPTDVQRAAFEMLLSGQDAVLLSETGTGKTLAYALPLLHQLITRAEAAAPADDDVDSAPVSARRSRTPADQALVLVPNRDLAAQVHGVIANLVEHLPASLQRSVHVSSLVSEVGADATAPILVATPAIAYKLWRGPESIRWLVLDEADALLAGSWKVAARAQYPVEQIVAQVKRTAKEEAAASVATADAAAAAVPRARAVRDPVARRAARAEALYATKQFVVTGATMPNAGTKNMEEHVKRLFPAAQWFFGARVHKALSRIAHYFVQIEPDARGTALQQALKHGPAGKVLIFANTHEVAQQALDDARIALGHDGVAIFHAGLPPAERARVLAAFHDAQPAALVCTGLASRGIDFVDVAHVVQYDVAHNAVEFMHRVGRTARAGKTGVATALYTADRAELVEGLRDALADGRPIDHLFSRKRSFTLQLKKRRKREAQESSW